MVALTIHSRQVGSATVLDPAGPLVGSAAKGALVGAVTGALSQGAKLIAVNLALTEGLDAPGFSELVRSLDLAKAKGARLRLFGLTLETKRVLRDVGYSNVFDVAVNEQAATHEP
jgi:anti-anti-sigma regulatory factor